MLATVPIFAAILRIPFSIIGPMIVVVCFIGAYTISGARLDLWLVLPFGLLGYAFKKLDVRAGASTVWISRCSAA